MKTYWSGGLAPLLLSSAVDDCSATLPGGNPSEPTGKLVDWTSEPASKLWRRETLASVRTRAPAVRSIAIPIPTVREGS
jgi:hypothetical protein